MSDVLLRTCQL